MKYRYCGLLIIILVLKNLSVLSQTSIVKAEDYFFGLDLENATHSYLNIFEDDYASNEDRVKAGRKLSYISWHFYGDLEKAREYAGKSLDFNTDEVSVYTDLIQYNSEARKYNYAFKVYQDALGKLTQEAERNILYIAYAKMILDEAFDNIIHEQSPDEGRLKDALLKIENVNRREPGSLEPANIQLGLALLLNDGARAMHAWNLYYHIPETREATGLLLDPQKRLGEVFKKWDCEELSNADIEALIINLNASRFYRYAYLMCHLFDSDKHFTAGEISDICNYFEYTIQIEERTFAYYRELSLSDRNNASDYEKEIRSIERDLWNKLHWQEKKTKYSDQKFREEIYLRFGTKVYDGTFSNSQYYIGGHSIIDSMIKVEQFNHQAEIQYIVLDHRFSNNYWGWFTGYMGFAGYADGSLIVRYREPSSGQPIIYWNKLNDPVLREIWLNKTAELSIQDDLLAISDPKASLSGIYNRIRINTYTQILDSLTSEGFQGEQLRVGFLSSFDEIIQSSNLHHEGRHAIDFNTLKRSEIDNDIEMEYRAKLSQIYFAQYPLLEIGFHIDNTPHGLANEKILGVFKNWMEQNKESIEDFDIDRPCLPQLDLLINNQIRNIIRSVEPFLN